MATKHATKKQQVKAKKHKPASKSPSPRKLLLISALTSSHSLIKIHILVVINIAQ
jgi:5-enolpyruvylshikimate-3-phosphate synthase